MVLFFDSDHKISDKRRKTASSGNSSDVASQFSSSTNVRGRIFDTISFSTDRNSIDPIGKIKVKSTKTSKGAINKSARVFSRRKDRASDFFNGKPSAAIIGWCALLSVIFVPGNSMFCKMQMKKGRKNTPLRRVTNYCANHAWNFASISSR